MNMKFTESRSVTFIIENIESETSFNDDDDDLFLRKNAEIKKASNQKLKEITKQSKEYRYRSGSQ